MDKCCGCRPSKEKKEVPLSPPPLSTTLVRQESGVPSNPPSLVSRDYDSDAEESDESEGEGDTMDEESSEDEKEKN